MGHTPREAIEFPHQDTLELPCAGGPHQRLELGAPFFPAGHRNIGILPANL